jgi:hypothetical protein
MFNSSCKDLISWVNDLFIKLQEISQEIAKTWSPSLLRFYFLWKSKLAAREQGRSPKNIGGKEFQRDHPCPQAGGYRAPSRAPTAK